MIYGYEIPELSNAIEELERQLLDPTALSTWGNFELLRYVAMQWYLRKLADGNGKMDSSDMAVRIFKNKGRFCKARMIRVWADLSVRGEALPISRRGRHPKRNSLIHDKDVKFACLEYLRSTDPQKLTPEVFMIHIKTVILPTITNNPDLETSKQTTYTWSAPCGYKKYDKKKEIFSDGHDRDDVVLTRHEFIRRMAEYTPLVTKWIEDGTNGLNAQQPALSENQK
ncbi:hypothetical protein K3495_g5993 [Podosphaera aphanis]|nr:hypothetical protein K3495_g5993 [Podosphaera aphanis]